MVREMMSPITERKILNKCVRSGLGIVGQRHITRHTAISLGVSDTQFYCLKQNEAHGAPAESTHKGVN